MKKIVSIMICIVAIFGMFTYTYEMDNEEIVDLFCEYENMELLSFEGMDDDGDGFLYIAYDRDKDTCVYGDVKIEWATRIAEKTKVENN